VAGDVMLLVVVRLHAYQELHMELLEAMRANPGPETSVSPLSSIKRRTT
jgi:hypothetical protein